MTNLALEGAGLERGKPSASKIKGHRWVIRKNETPPVSNRLSNPPPGQRFPILLQLLAVLYRISYGERFNVGTART